MPPRREISLRAACPSPADGTRFDAGASPGPVGTIGHRLADAGRMGDVGGASEPVRSKLGVTKRGREAVRCKGGRWVGQVPSPTCLGAAEG